MSNMFSFRVHFAAMTIIYSRSSSRFSQCFRKESFSPFHSIWIWLWIPLRSLVLTKAWWFLPGSYLPKHAMLALFLFLMFRKYLSWNLSLNINLMDFGGCCIGSLKWQDFLLKCFGGMRDVKGCHTNWVWLVTLPNNLRFQARSNLT